MSEEQKKRGAHFTFNGNYQPQVKNTSLAINEESSKSCPSQKGKISKQLSNAYSPHLPINLFHSPGQYNKMIIKCANPHSQTNLEKQMGIVKTLQFVNQPFFQNEKQKRYQRLKNYCEQMEKNKAQYKLKSSQVNKNCNCCCCNDFCSQCAKETNNCSISKSRKQSEKLDWLIDIQKLRQNVSEKQNLMKKSSSKEFSQVHSHEKKSCKHNFKIDMLVTNTLFKEIQMKRQKMLQKLDLIEREKMREEFNESVRRQNKQRASSAQLKPQKKRQPSKQHIREAYWNSIKQLVALQLQKDKKLSHIQEKAEKKQKMKFINPYAQDIAIGRLIVKRANQALKQINKQKQAQVKLQKIKAKKLLALAVQQAQILKKSKAKKFKPTESMLEKAFRQIE